MSLSKTKSSALERGSSLRAEAESALGKFSLFGFGKSQKHEDAAEKFKASGNAYKLGEDFRNAAEMFVKASEHFTIGDSATDSVGMMVEAANCYEKDKNQVEALNAYLKAVEMYNISGRFSRSSQYMKKIAEIYEGNKDYNEAFDAYEQAASMYENDNKKSAAQGCYLKIASMAMEKDIFDKGAEIYTKIGMECMDSNLGKYAAKGHFFNASLCFLAQGDLVAITNKLEEFKNADFSFGSSRECQFVEELVNAVSENSSQAYAQACADFDRISPLDPIKTHVLMKGKANIMEEGDEVDLNGTGGGEAGGEEAVSAIADGEEDEEDLT
jgi:alpha-soluble NSF attachment protein